MGARLARIFRNYNVEDRALREISKEKPRSAPRHVTTAMPTTVSSEAAELVTKKNESLLEHLRSVYVESTDPTAAPEFSGDVFAGKEADRRPLKVSLPGGLELLVPIPSWIPGKRRATPWTGRQSVTAFLFHSHKKIKICVFILFVHQF
ncbi:NADH dehydrogenase [ubiquinone] 1 alpha subcomplex assembly factor 4 isoform X2 [Poeciliopsis prolifica]|uniref:NADH dehydrogenase [ubiquinone] 1 alpha subcomplex assembly factor 4 isoform X2 n=1 Tax=Poeciliopsis prolifica TaxID=188132 RepID=UPI0024133303|nr:NADH dehydrogenase [ubiquinone] 1 alpha subcomplex assembly factor 4 isoform X2 [Poeciliopsis prolifica]